MANSAQESRNSHCCVRNRHNTELPCTISDSIPRVVFVKVYNVNAFTLIEKDGFVLLFIPFLVRPADSHDSCWLLLLPPRSWVGAASGTASTPAPVCQRANRHGSGQRRAVGQTLSGHCEICGSAAAEPRDWNAASAGWKCTCISGVYTNCLNSHTSSKCFMFLSHQFYTLIRRRSCCILIFNQTLFIKHISNKSQVNSS